MQPLCWQCRSEHAAKQEQLNGLRQLIVALELQLKNTVGQPNSVAITPDSSSLEACIAAAERAEAAAAAAHEAAEAVTSGQLGSSMPDSEVKELQASVELLRGQVLELEAQVCAGLPACLLMRRYSCMLLDDGSLGVMRSVRIDSQITVHHSPITRLPYHQDTRGALSFAVCGWVYL